MERHFGDKKSGTDEFMIYDNTTKLKTDDFSSNIGEELFGIDMESFMRTVFIAHNPWSMRVAMTGKVSVITKVNAFGEVTEREFKDFGKVYKLFYRSGDNDLVHWSRAGIGSDGEEITTGSDNTTFNMLEFKLMLVDAEFNTGTTTNQPIIEAYPKDTTITIGNSAAFSVKAIGQDLTYQWYMATSTGKNSEGIKIEADDTNSADSPVLRIPNAGTEKNGTEYYCVITKPTMDGKTSSIATPTATLTVTRAIPVLLNVPESNVSGNVGSTVNITGLVAKSGDAGDITYEWQYGDGSEGWTKFTDGANGGADISFVLKKEYHGRYMRCKITAVNSSDPSLSKSVYTDPIQIDCSIAPTVKLVINSNYVTKGNAAIQLQSKVTASGTGSVYYRWFVREKDASQWVEYSNNSSSFSQTPSETGVWEFKVSVVDNTHPDLGEGTDSAVVYVGIAPKITEITAEVKDTDSDDTVNWNVSVKFDGSDLGKKTYKWYVDGELIEGADSNTALLKGIKTGQRVITCVVSDEFGKSSMTKTVFCEN